MDDNEIVTLLNKSRLISSASHHEGDETINEIMKDVTFQSNNKEEKSQNNIPQKNNQKTSEKGIIAIKRKIQKSMLPTKFGGEHIYCTQMFSYPTYQIKQLSTITGRDQQNKQAQMVFTTIGNKKLLNHLSEDVWGKKYSNSDIYKRNAHTITYTILQKKQKKIKRKRTIKM